MTNFKSLINAFEGVMAAVMVVDQGCHESMCRVMQPERSRRCCRLPIKIAGRCPANRS